MSRYGIDRFRHELFDLAGKVDGAPSEEERAAADVDPVSRESDPAILAEALGLRTEIDRKYWTPGEVAVEAAFTDESIEPDS